MPNLSKKIIEKIEEEKIVPKPKWQFTAHEVLLWLFFAMAVLAGAFAVSGILHNLLVNDWGAFRPLNRNPFEFIFLSIPYFWIIIFIGLLALAYLDFKKTEDGYKFRSVWVVSLSLGLSIIFGTVLYFGGIGERADRFLEQAPLMQNFDMRQKLWNNPEKNALMGEVITVSDSLITIKEPNGKEWEVDISKLEKIPELSVGDRIRIAGEKTADGKFKAITIWEMKQPIRGRFQNFKMQVPAQIERNNFDTRIN